MKILISESQYFSLIESEVTESKHDNKDIKKLISWAEKKIRLHIVFNKEWN